MTYFGKVAVLMGGKSAEREISLLSGNAVLQSLQAQQIDAVAIEPDHAGISRLVAGEFDRAFIILHGRGGEDGTIQGLLETIGIPYTGSGVLASALAMDKYRTKQIWQAASLPTPAYMTLTPPFDAATVLQQLGGKIMIKPAHEGSSIGMSIVSSISELEQAYRSAAEFDQFVLAEQYISGKEYTIAIVANQALPVIRVETPNTFYDFQAKYRAGTTSYNIPSGLSSTDEQELQQLSMEAFAVCGARGWGRVDVMRDSNGQFWLIELNTVPGMTQHSLVPKAARAAGISFDQLVVKLLQETLSE